MMELFYRHLAARIRRERERLGLSQAELGGALGLTRQSVANIEAAKQRVLAHQIPVFAAALDVPIERLFMPTVYRRKVSGIKNGSEPREDEASGNSKPKGAHHARPGLST